jgi:hypothetical protein
MLETPLNINQVIPKKNISQINLRFQRCVTLVIKIN